MGTGTNPDFCLQVIKNDIQPWYLSRYTSSGAWIRTTNNAEEVQRQCQYYADALAKTLETVRSLTRTYIGLYRQVRDRLHGGQVLRQTPPDPGGVAFTVGDDTGVFASVAQLETPRTAGMAPLRLTGLTPDAV